jgi:GntR family transcriptional regulator
MLPIMAELSINPGTAEHPSRQIAAQLRGYISGGHWQPGDRLPSIPSLATQYGVARQTVQRAIDQLRVEGLVLTKPGSGTFVRGSRRQLHRLSRSRYGRARGYHRDMPVRYRQHLIAVGRAGAPAEVATPFRVEPGTELIVRRHVLYLGDQPAEVGASWLRTTDAAGTRLESPDPIRGPLYLAVEDVTGRRYARATDHITWSCRTWPPTTTATPSRSHRPPGPAPGPRWSTSTPSPATRAATTRWTTTAATTSCWPEPGRSGP